MEKYQVNHDKQHTFTAGNKLAAGRKFTDGGKGTCIKELFWPPLGPKTENCFSPISSYWFIRGIAQV